MNRRFWLYSAALIVIIGQLSYLSLINNSTNKAVSQINQEYQRSSLEQIERYAKEQTDERKLVRLAKAISKTDSRLVEPLVLKAFELNPDSRDIALLASQYSQEAAKRAKEIDPLYKN